MVLFPIRSLDRGHICLFVSSTWVLVLHCTNPDTKWQWALRVIAVQSSVESKLDQKICTVHC